MPDGIDIIKELKVLLTQKVGEDIKDVNFGFIQLETFASKGQKLIYHGALKKYEKFLLQSPTIQ